MADACHYIKPMGQSNPDVEKQMFVCREYLRSPKNNICRLVGITAKNSRLRCSQFISRTPRRWNTLRRKTQRAISARKIVSIILLTRQRIAPLTIDHTRWMRYNSLLTKEANEWHYTVKNILVAQARSHNSLEHVRSKCPKESAEWYKSTQG